MDKNNFWIIVITGVFGVAGIAITGRMDNQWGTGIFLLLCLTLIVVLSIVFKEKK